MQPGPLQQRLAVLPSTVSVQEPGNTAAAVEQVAPARERPSGFGEVATDSGAGCSGGSGVSSVHDSAASGLVHRTGKPGDASRLAEDALLREVMGRLKGTPDPGVATALPGTRLRRPSAGRFAALPAAKQRCEQRPAAAAGVPKASMSGSLEPVTASDAQQRQQQQQGLSGASSVQCVVRLLNLDGAMAAAAAGATWGSCTRDPTATASNHSTDSPAGFSCRVRLPGSSSGDMPCATLPCSRLPAASRVVSGAERTAPPAVLHLSSGSCTLPVSVAARSTHTATVELWQHHEGGPVADHSHVTDSVSVGHHSSATRTLLGLAAVPLAGHPAASDATGPPAVLAEGCFQLRDVLTGRRVGSVNVAFRAAAAIPAPADAATAAAALAVAAAEAAQPASSGSAANVCQQPAAAGGASPTAAAPAVTPAVDAAGGDGGRDDQQRSADAGAAAPAAGYGSPTAPAVDVAAPAASGVPNPDSYLIRVHHAHGLATAPEGALLVSYRLANNSIVRGAPVIVIEPRVDVALMRMSHCLSAASSHVAFWTAGMLVSCALRLPDGTAASGEAPCHAAAAAIDWAHHLQPVAGAADQPDLLVGCALDCTNKPCSMLRPPGCSRCTHMISKSVWQESSCAGSLETSKYFFPLLC